jgi:uncharacterized protein DUF2855
VSTVTTLQVRRDQLAQTRLVQHSAAALAQGQVRVCVERFALTSNNITYAAFGERMGYWQFFPSGEDGWGVVPVWGFGTVKQSLHPDVAVGERLYGYFPMADSVVLQPGRLSPGRMAEESPHRAALPVVYNQYFRCAADPLYTPDSEDLQALLRPLFITSWLIDDFFDDNGFFGAQPGTALVSSASSKTAWGTAFLMHQRPGIEVVGITSPVNRAYCESLGCYHRVLAYDQLDQVAADAPCVYIDFAGSGEVRRAIHTRIAALKYSCVIGNTHVDERAPEGSAANLPGPRATFFFAPAQIKKRVGEWGGEAFEQRMVQAWRSVLAQVADPAAPWLQVEHHRGREAAQAVYAQVLGGRGNPRVGHIVLPQG